MSDANKTADAAINTSVLRTTVITTVATELATTTATVTTIRIIQLKAITTITAATIHTRHARGHATTGTILTTDPAAHRAAVIANLQVKGLYL